MVKTQKNELAALGLVNRHPMHGYALNQEIKQMGLEHWTTVSRSSIYAALRRLAKKGAVSVTKEREGHMPMRSVYHITPMGREMLGEILRGAVSYIGPEDRYFYLGVAFADGLPMDEIVEILDIRCRRLGELAEQEKADTEYCEKHIPHLMHIILMTRTGRKHMEIEHEFCRDLLDFFRANPDYFNHLIELREAAKEAHEN